MTKIYSCRLKNCIALTNSCKLSKNRTLLNAVHVRYLDHHEETTKYANHIDIILADLDLEGQTDGRTELCR